MNITFWQKNIEFMCGNESRSYRNKGKKLLENVDWLTDEHFTKKLILREVWWCAQQMLQKRILNT